MVLVDGTGVGGLDTTTTSVGGEVGGGLATTIPGEVVGVLGGLAITTTVVVGDTLVVGDTVVVGDVEGGGLVKTISRADTVVVVGTASPTNTGTSGPGPSAADPMAPAPAAPRPATTTTGTAKLTRRRKVLRRPRPIGSSGSTGGVVTSLKLLSGAPRRHHSSSSTATSLSHERAPSRAALDRCGAEFVLERRLALRRQIAPVEIEQRGFE